MTVVAESDTTILHLTKEFLLTQCSNNKHFLIDFLHYEYHCQNSNVIELNYTKKELAERLGIPRTSLSRELRKMCEDGLVEFDSKSISMNEKLINLLRGYYD